MVLYPSEARFLSCSLEMAPPRHHDARSVFVFLIPECQMPMSRTYCLPVVLASVCLLVCRNGATASDRPNIVWLVSEDNSTHYLEFS